MGIGGKFGDIAETFFQAFDQAVMKGRFRGGELVVGPKALLTFDDEAGFEQVGEMARGGRLRDAKNADDIADAKLAVEQKMQDAETSEVREGAEHDVDSGFAHILYSPKRI